MENTKNTFNLKTKLYILFGKNLPKTNRVKDVLDKCSIPYNENELIKLTK